MQEQQQSMTTKPVALVAEDDNNSAKLLQVILEILGFVVFRAKSGTEIIALYQDHPDATIILMDMQMPIMNGYEATKEIRRLNSDVVIIAQTGYAMSTDMEQCLEVGCTDYLTKPITKTTLTQMIRKYGFIQP